MHFDPADHSPELAAFLTERHLASLTTLRPDGRPHVVPVGFTYDPGTTVARVITDAASVKARNASRGGRAALCQVAGGRWLTLEGTASVSDDPSEVADAERRYADRYRIPRINPTRVVVYLLVDRIIGRV